MKLRSRSISWFARGLVGLLAASALELRAAPPGQSPITGSDTSTFTSPAGYGKPNQSRIWWNAAAARWDGIVPRNLGQGSDHYVMKDVVGARTFTSVKVEDRDTARPDAFWVGASQTLYVLGSHASESRIWRVSYEAGSDTYAVDPQVNGISVPGLFHDVVDGDNRPATLYLSPNGYLWAAVVRDTNVRVQRSTDGGETWEQAPATVGTTQVPAVTTWSHFDDGSTIRVGLFVGENGTEGALANTFYYWTLPQDADPLGGGWNDESANVPGPVGTETADDHVSSARDEDGNLYFAVKSEVGEPSDPRIKLLRRTPGGSWSQFLVTAAGEEPEQTRPSVVIDAENDRVHVFTTDTGAGLGRRFDADLDDLDSLATVPPLIVFAVPDEEFDDIIVPRGTVDSDSGLAVLVHDETTAQVWRSVASVPPEEAGRLIIAGFQSTNDVGHGPAEFVSLFNTTDAPLALDTLDLVVHSDADGDGDVEVLWRLSDQNVDLSNASIAPYGFFLLAESAVPAPGGVHDLELDLDLPASEGGADERAISLELQLGGLTMDYVVYGRHNGSDSGAHPPGDIPFDTLTFPRREVIRSIQSSTSFQEGVVQRLSPAALHAGNDVPGFYTDESTLGSGFPPGVWTSPHSISFDDYEARNSLSPAVPFACAVDTDGDSTADCLDPDDDGDGFADGADCAPLEAEAWAIPGEVLDLVLDETQSGTRLEWNAPGASGGTAVGFDLLRASAPEGFGSATCLLSGDPALEATDDALVPPGAVRFYLVRATNACGDGTLGFDSERVERIGVTCP